MPNLREPLLRASFGRADVVFASGASANNKLSLGYDEVSRFPELRAQVIEELGKLAVVHNPDLIIPIPDGANGYGSKVARALRIDCMILSKNPDTKEIFFQPGDQESIKKYTRIVILEDVPNSFTTTSRVLALEGMMERAVALVGIWDRGDPDSRPSLPDGIALSSIVQEYIPAPLKANSELWSYAQ